MYSVAILAGGLATRLRPLTEAIPKSLIEVAGKPFICHQLDYLQGQGIKSVVLCIGYLGEMIKEVVGNGLEWGIEVQYSMDGSKLLGTGGAIKKALPLLADHFFILYGDSYLPINFKDVKNAYELSHKKGLMTVLKNDNLWDKSNVEFLGGQIVEYNKFTSNARMRHIDYGLSVLEASVIKSFDAKDSFDLSDVYNYLSMKGDLAGFEVFDRFYEIGSSQGIEDANHYLQTINRKGIK
jgi:MurNAc alpha-1-phosphate uridylyltransferase